MTARADGHPDSDRLATVALGDLDELTRDELAHVQACPECTAEVAALRATAGRLREARSPAPVVGPGVWDSVLRELGDEAPGARVVPTSAHHRRSPRRRALLGLAAAVALVVAIGAGVLLGRSSPGTTTPAPGPLYRADLTTVGGSAPRGTAEVVRRDGRLALVVAAADLGSAKGWHEVWLMDLSRRKLVSLGTLGQGESGTFTLPRSLLREGYDTVDVSLEADDGNPGHSGDSLARGTLRQG